MSLLPVINTHILSDGSVCFIPSRASDSPETRVFEVFSTSQGNSLLCGQTDAINLEVASFLTLSDVAAARLSCKWLHKLFSNPQVWHQLKSNMWFWNVENLPKAGPLFISEHFLHLEIYHASIKHWILNLRLANKLITQDSCVLCMQKEIFSLSICINFSDMILRLRLHSFFNQRESPMQFASPL